MNGQEGMKRVYSQLHIHIPHFLESTPPPSFASIEENGLPILWVKIYGKI